MSDASASLHSPTHRNWLANWQTVIPSSSLKRRSTNDHRRSKVPHARRNLFLRCRFGRSDCCRLLSRWHSVPTCWRARLMSKRHRYQLTIATASNLTDDESHRCLRAVLKCMLRSFGVRCLSAVAITAADDAEDEPQQPIEAINDN